MCTDTMKDFLRALPKCEHHIHIEGSLSPSLLFDLSRRNKIQLPASDLAYASIQALEERYRNFSDLQDFLDYYYMAMSTLITATDFELLMESYLHKARSDGVLHAEIFFDPQAHTSRGIPLDVVVNGLEAAIANQKDAISIILVPCFLRHLPASAALTTLQDLEPFVHASSSIKGVGLDSAELPFPPQLFADVFAASSRMGLQLTAHAGEEGPAGYIAAALDTLHVTRIDHGIRLVEDPVLLDRIVRDGILLTVCPLSNVCLKAVGDVKDLPIPLFLEKGVKFSINSDDPAYFGGYILDNYLAVQKAFSLTKSQWATIVTNGIQGSWCEQITKQEMLRNLDAVMEKYTEI